jgi:hypothetical protein
MPFKSKAQERYLFATHPKVAKEFAAATPKGAKLPEHVKNPKANASPKSKRPSYAAAMSSMVRK